MAKKHSSPPDGPNRNRIANELDRTLLVEAAAGTGKTTCLVTRMVNLLRHEKSRIDTLVAVTFTRKAAAELRARFQLALEVAARESTGDERERLAFALHSIERCFIGTIHSFCARLLRERPVEAGVDPGFVELDEFLDEQLRQRAWREHVAKLVATDDPILPELEKLGLKISPETRRTASLVSELDELGLEPAELGPAFMRFAEYADVEQWPAEPVPLPDLQPCIDELQSYVEHMRQLTLPADPGNDELMPKYESIPRLVGQLNLNRTSELMEALAQFHGDKKIVQRNWPGKKEQANAEKSRWSHFVQQFAEPLLLAWREHRYEPSMRAIRPALDLYQQLRRDRNGLNFQDLLLLAVALLRDKPEVRRYFRERFTHLLVDEFQDTDPLQAELMLLLTADDATQTNWQECRPVAGSLFVVGDPKQSIYRFRRADILTYNKVRSIMENTGGEVVSLSSNFRSVQPIIDWVNGCFGDFFPAKSDAFSPANRPLDVGRTGTPVKQPAIQRLLVPDSLKQQDQVAEYEAGLIARAIRQALDERWPVPRTESERRGGLPEYAIPGDFLIIARVKARLSVYARKLQEYSIPHAVSGGSVLNEVPELALLQLCLSAVSRPDDPIALVAALRSELFGVADTTLYEFRRRGGRFAYYSPVPQDLPAHDFEELSAVFQRMQTYALWLRKSSPATAIERMAADLGLIARACAAEEGDSHAGSLLKAIELLRELDAESTIADFEVALGRLVKQDELHDGVPVRPPARSPVRVMNLHQCKGLEAPFVFLVDPSGEPRHEVREHIDRSDEVARGYLAIYGPRYGKYKPPTVLAQPRNWSALAEQEQQFLDAEANRLLYVAATRAGVRLVISQRAGTANGKSKNPWQPFNAYLENVGDVEMPSNTPPQVATKKLLAPMWREEIASIERRWQVATRPSYAVQAIKETAIPGGRKPHGAEAQGAEWGNVLHMLLESLMKRPHTNLKSLALSALASQRLPSTLLDEAKATVEQVAASEVWQRALGAALRLTEVPIALPIESTESNKLPVVLRGVIDLAFRDARGWTIVDYKSERVGASDVPALVQYYKPQLESYADIWQRIVHEPVIERGLLFTHSGKYETLP